MTVDAEPDLQWQEALVVELTEAREAAVRIVGREPLGLRAVEPAPGQRWYLCAFDGPSFLCLDVTLRPEAEHGRIREVASGNLLIERAEGLIDSAELSYLAGAAGRLLAATAEPAEVTASLEAVAQRALEMAAWRESPQREVASVAALDTAIALHERFHRAYGHFVSVSQPLVEKQDELDPELVSGLRVFEEAAGRAGVGDSLARILGQIVEDCAEGAEQVLSSLVVQQRSRAGGS